MKKANQLQEVTNLFEFLKQYYAIKNPTVKSIEMQPWSRVIEELPNHATITSYLNKPLEDGLVLKIRKPSELECENNQQIEEIFNSFYTLYARMKKEAEAVELIYGQMYLKYKEIEHPVVLQQMTLEFDASVPEFKIYIADQEPELYRSVLNLVKDVDEELLIEVFKKFSKDPISPFEVEKLKLLIEQINYALVHEQKDGMKIEERGVVFLRKRNVGVNDAIDAILEDIEQKQEVPSFISDIVGTKPSSPSKSGYKSQNDIKALEKKILLTKPANSEQLLVAKQLQKNEAVLVQGPPGTGKTHTIANILGHLLSEGKNVLVTSYSEKALTVIKDQVIEDLQPLCLSVLSSSKSREELEETLDTIHDYRSTLDKNELTKRINAADKNREACLNTLKRLRADLKNIRTNEQASIKIGSKIYKPLEAAKYVEENREWASQIPGPVRIGSGLPITINEVEELYTLNERFTKEQERIIECPLPSVTQLLKPEELENFVKLSDAITKQLNNESCAYLGSEEKKLNVEELNQLLQEVAYVINQIEIEHTWVLETLEAGKEEKTKEKWLGLVASVKEVYQLSQTYADEIMTYNPEIMELDEKIKPLDIYSQINDKLQKSGKLTKITQLLNPAIKTVIEASKVNGKAPESIKDFEVLIHYTVLEEKREQLKARWNRQMASLGAKRAEQLGEQFEEGCQKYADAILMNLEWYKGKWKPLVSKLEKVGINADALLSEQVFTTNKYQELKYIKENISDKLNQAIEYKIYKRQKELVEQQKMLIDEAIVGDKKATDSEVLQAFKIAVYKNDYKEYKIYYDQIIQAKQLQPIIEERNSYLERIDYVAPVWAEAIREKESTLPENIEGAWLCKQFIENFSKRGERTIDKVREEIKEVEVKLNYYTKQLATDRAWLYKLVNFESNKEQVQAIEGWKQLILKIGAGKGKQAEMLKKEAKQLMPKCQSAVPAWIMPLNKVLENFNAKMNKFDVVIIDEASQADILALVALYLGKQVLIVGDDEQVSPLAIGERIEEVERLAKEYLEDVPNSYLYSGKFSIYDLAGVSGYQPVKLKEHFRCVPDIIGYSNQLSYKGEIQALRDDSKVVIKPAIQSTYIDGAKEEDGINEKEATAIVDQIIKCIKDKAYQDKTIGVISLKGDKQATYIESLLQKKIDPEVYTSRKILCGNPSHFQGDERDIVFLSFIESCEEGEMMRLLGYGADNLYKKRYNVAMSRAKDQVWLVHSFDSKTALKDGDIRRELFEYWDKQKEKCVQEEAQCTSLQAIIKKECDKRGLSIRDNKSVGSYKLDFVIEKGEKSLGVVIDDWETKDILQFEKEMEQQSVLERAGWELINVSEPSLWMDYQEVIDNIEKRL